MFFVRILAVVKPSHHIKRLHVVHEQCYQHGHKCTDHCVRISIKITPYRHLYWPLDIEDSWRKNLSQIFPIYHLIREACPLISTSWPQNRNSWPQQNSPRLSCSDLCMMEISSSTRLLWRTACYRRRLWRITLVMLLMDWLFLGRRIVRMRMREYYIHLNGV